MKDKLVGKPNGNWLAVLIGAGVLSVCVIVLPGLLWLYLAISLFPWPFPQGGQPLPPIHSAAMVGDIVTIEQELQSGVPIDLDAANLANVPDGTTPLMLAARAGEHEVAKLLLKRGADVKKTDSAGRTAFHWAALSSAAQFDYLLEAGAEIDAKDLFGHTALMRATLYGPPRNIEALLSLDADTSVVDNEGRGVVELLKTLRPRRVDALHILQDSNYQD